MPTQTLTVEDLGKAVKSKYAGQYDDLGDAELGQRVQAKFPGAYDDYTPIARPTAPVAAAPAQAPMQPYAAQPPAQRPAPTTQLSVPPATPPAGQLMHPDQVEAMATQNAQAIAAHLAAPPPTGPQMILPENAPQAPPAAPMMVGPVMRRTPGTETYRGQKGAQLNVSGSNPTQAPLGQIIRQGMEAPIIKPEDIDEAFPFLVGPFALHKGIIKAGAAMTSPANAAIAAGTAGLGSIPGLTAKVASAGLSAYFATQAGKQLLEKYPPIKDAIAKNDWQGALELGGGALADAAMFYGAGKHALGASLELPGDIARRRQRAKTQAAAPPPEPPVYNTTGTAQYRPGAEPAPEPAPDIAPVQQLEPTKTAPVQQPAAAAAPVQGVAEQPQSTPPPRLKTYEESKAAAPAAKAEAPPEPAQPVAAKQSTVPAEASAGLPESMRHLLDVRAVKRGVFPAEYEGSGGRYDPKSKTIFVEHGETDPNVVRHEALHNVTRNLAGEFELVKKYIAARYRPEIAREFLDKLSPGTGNAFGYAYDGEEDFTKSLQQFVERPAGMRPELRSVFEERFGAPPAAQAVAATPAKAPEHGAFGGEKVAQWIAGGKPAAPVKTAPVKTAAPAPAPAPEPPPNEFAAKRAEAQKKKYQAKNAARIEAKEQAFRDANEAARARNEESQKAAAAPAKLAIVKTPTPAAIRAKAIQELRAGGATYKEAVAKVDAKEPAQPVAGSRSQDIQDLPPYVQSAIMEDSMTRRTNEGGGIDSPDPYAGVRWKLEKTSLEDLKPDNEMLWDKTRFQHRPSMTKGPIVVSDRGEIIDGNNRLFEALHRGDKTIEVYRPDAPAQPRAAKVPAATAKPDSAIQKYMARRIGRITELRDGGMTYREAAAQADKEIPEPAPATPAKPAQPVAKLAAESEDWLERAGWRADLDRAADAAETRINKFWKDAGTTTNVGLPVHILGDYAIKGARVIVNGVDKFGAWSEAMLKDAGESLKPHLRAIWAESKHIAGLVKPMEMYQRLTVPVKVPKGIPAVSQAPKLHLMADAFGALDEWHKANPRAFSSTQNYLKGMAELFRPQSGRVLIPPSNLIEYASNDAALGASIDEVTAPQRAMADRGLQDSLKVRQAYRDGVMRPEHTAEYFIWGALSARMSPYPHEAGFLRALDGGIEHWVSMAARGEFDAKALEAYLDWSARTVKGTPAAPTTSNLNRVGQGFLTNAAKPVANGPYAGMRTMDALHQIITAVSKGDLSAVEARRRYQQINNGLGGDNKIFSFVLLVTGNHHVIVADRVRINDFWGAPELERQGLAFNVGEGGERQPTSNLYDGGLSAPWDGVTGLGMYEAAESALADRVRAAYLKRGIKDGTLGRWHWETWVAKSGQEVSHGSLGAIVKRAREGLTGPAAATGEGIRQGKFNDLAYGVTYTKTPQGWRYVWEKTNGEKAVLTPEQHQSLLDDLRNQRDRATYTEKERSLEYRTPTAGAKSRPWRELPGVNKPALDQAIDQHAGLLETNVRGRELPVPRGARSTGILDRVSEAGKNSDEWLRKNGITGGGSLSANRVFDPEVVFHLTRAVAGDVARGIQTARGAAEKLYAKFRDGFDSLGLSIGDIEKRITEHLPAGAAKTAAVPVARAAERPKPAPGGDAGVTMGAGLGAFEPFLRASIEDMRALKAKRDAALEALERSKITEGQKQWGDQVRHYFTSERDVWAARANQGIAKARKLTLPSRNRRTGADVTAEAVAIAREFKRAPAGELQSILDGSHADLAKLDPDDRTRVMARIEALRPAIERALAAPDKAMQAVDQFYTNMAQITGNEGRRVGNLEATWNPETYVPHVLHPKGEGAVATPRKAVGQALGGRIGKYFGFSQERSYPTLLHAIMADVVPKTTNIHDAFTIQQDHFARSRATRLLEDSLRNTDVGKYTVKASAPEGWIPIAPQSNEFRTLVPYDTGTIDEEGLPVLDVAEKRMYVAPHIEQALRPITSPDFTTEIAAVHALRISQAATKAAQLGLSFFHATTENYMALANMGPKGWIRALRADRDSPEFLKAERDLIAHGGTSSIQGNTVEAYHAMQPGSIPTYGDIWRQNAAVKVMDQAAKAISDLTFANLQRRFKVTDYQLHVAAWMAKHPGASGRELARAKQSMAKEVNAIYGGLHWENIGLNKSTVEIARAIMLAPDWTLSNIFNVKYAFEKSPGGRMARMFWVRTLVGGVIATQAASLMFSGKPSKRPTMVYMGHDSSGKEIYQNIFFKGAPGDATNLVTNIYDYGLQGIVRTLAGKGAPVVRTALQLASNQDYLTRKIVPKGMNPIASSARTLWSAAKSLSPFPLSLSNLADMMFGPEAHKYKFAELLTTMFAGNPPSHVAPAGTHIGAGGELRPNAPREENTVLDQALSGSVYKKRGTR